MFSIKDPSSHLLRWRLLLEEYDYTIEYKAGKENAKAHPLSRKPVVMTIDYFKRKTKDFERKA
jgi:hypothetical protein